MRAFLFDKEPTFKAQEATNLIGELISAGASLLGGAIGSGDSKAAATASARATSRQMQMLRDANAQNTAYLSPHVARGNRAKAYLDAVTYGSGTYGGADDLGANPYVTSSDKWQKYLDQNPDVAAAAKTTKMGQADPLAYAEWHYGNSGKQEIANGQRAPFDPENIGGNAADAAGDSQGYTVSGDDALSTLYGTPEWQWNEGDYATRQVMTDEDYATRQGMTEADYLARQGYTADEIAAWMAKADVAEGRAVDQMFSRGGVTGNVGHTRAGVAQVGQDFARDRAQYSAGRKRADYDIYSGRKDADYGTYSGRKASNFETYAGGKRNAYGDWLDRLDGDATRGYQAATGIGSAGQAYANTASNTLGQGARQQASYLSDAADKWASGVQGAIGYAADAWKGAQKPKTKTTAPSDSGYWGSGGYKSDFSYNPPNYSFDDASW